MHIKLLRRVDRYIIWMMIFFFCRWKYLFCRKTKTILQDPKKILIIRLWWLGSTILTFPMVKQLQDHYGQNVQYDVLGTKRNLFLLKKQNYFKRYFDFFDIRDLVTLLKMIKSYDIVIDTEEYFRASTLLSIRLGKYSVWFGALQSRKIWYKRRNNYG